MPYKESRLTPQIIADLRWRRHRGRDPRAAALIEARRDRQERGLQPSVEDALFNQIDKSKGAARRHWPLLVGLALETGARAGELLQAPRTPDGKVFPWLGSPERASATLGKFARQAGMDGCRSLDLRDMALHRAFAKWGLPSMAVGLVFGYGSETLLKRFADWSRLQAPSASIRHIAPWLCGDAPAPLPFHWSALASAPSANMLAPIRHQEAP